MIRKIFEYLFFMTAVVIVAMLVYALFQHDLARFWKESGVLAWVYIGLWVFFHALAWIFTQMTRSMRAKSAKTHDAVTRNKTIDKRAVIRKMEDGVHVTEQSSLFAHRQRVYVKPLDVYGRVTKIVTGPHDTFQYVVECEEPMLHHKWSGVETDLRDAIQHSLEAP